MECIQQLLFALNMTSLHPTDDWELPENIIPHILSPCPNLEYLYLTTCVLKQSPYTTIDLNKKFSLVELYINECHLYPGTLEQLSLLLREIKQLRLGGIGYYTSDESQSFRIRYYTDLDITMPYTEIDDIIFDNTSYSQNLYLKISVLDHEIQYYHHLESSINEFEILNEQDYATRVKDGMQISICCAKKPNFRFEIPKYYSL